MKRSRAIALSLSLACLFTGVGHAADSVFTPPSLQYQLPNAYQAQIAKMADNVKNAPASGTKTRWVWKTAMDQTMTSQNYATKWGGGTYYTYWKRSYGYYQLQGYSATAGMWYDIPSFKGERWLSGGCQSQSVGGHYSPTLYPGGWSWTSPCWGLQTLPSL